MKEIHVILIIFMLFILYNYFYVYKREPFESTSYTKSIKDLLESGKFNNVDITGNELKLGNEKTSLSGKKYGNEWLVLNPNNNYKDGVFVESNLKIGLSDQKKNFCIGDTCITENTLKHLNYIIDLFTGKYPLKFSNGSKTKKCLDVKNDGD
jgi:hypothetical protein